MNTEVGESDFTTAVTTAVSRPMLIVIHDFAPMFTRELNSIVETLFSVVGHKMSAAVVPRWHGSTSGKADRVYLDLLSTVEERLLHGWMHQSRHRYAPVSLMTDRADEFRGVSDSTILKQITLAQIEFAELTGEPACGFLPPAWQLPIPSTKLRSFQFVMRFRALESCQTAAKVRSLATWSWDWGRLGYLAYGGEVLGGLLSWCDSTAIPAIAIHPADVRRGYFPRAVRLIRRLVEIGYEPTTASQVM